MGKILEKREWLDEESCSSLLFSGTCSFVIKTLCSFEETVVKVVLAADDAQWGQTKKNGNKYRTFKLLVQSKNDVHKN